MRRPPWKPFPRTNRPLTMHRLWLALKLFFHTLFHADVAARLERALRTDEQIPEAEQKTTAPPPTPQPSSPVPARSEAITLLATLQREARLVDFLMEPLDEYSDAQIGAAVRDVQRNARATLERLFDLQPVAAGQEGERIEQYGLGPGSGAERS